MDMLHTIYVKTGKMSGAYVTILELIVLCQKPTGVQSFKMVKAGAWVKATASGNHVMDEPRGDWQLRIKDCTKGKNGSLKLDIGATNRSMEMGYLTLICPLGKYAMRLNYSMRYKVCKASNWAQCFLFSP